MRLHGSSWIRYLALIYFHHFSIWIWYVFSLCVILMVYTSATIQSVRLDHGSPITRRRIFIILILTEIMDQSVRGRLQQFCEATRERLRMHLDLHWPLGTTSLKFLDCVKLTGLNLMAHFHHPIHNVPGRTFSWTTGTRLSRMMFKQKKSWGEKTWLVKGLLVRPNNLHLINFDVLAKPRKLNHHALKWMMIMCHQPHSNLQLRQHQRNADPKWMQQHARWAEQNDVPAPWL